MRWDSSRGLHQGQQTFNGCTNRPNRELHPTYVRSSNYTCNAGAIHRERPLLGSAESATNDQNWVYAAANLTVGIAPIADAGLA